MFCLNILFYYNTRIGVVIAKFLTTFFYCTNVYCKVWKCRFTPDIINSLVHWERCLVSIKQYEYKEESNEDKEDAKIAKRKTPRRILALSVAERVAVEMDDTVGNYVGYQIRMEVKRSKNTKLMFCTTGVILRWQQDDQHCHEETIYTWATEGASKPINYPYAFYINTSIIWTF